MDDVFGVARIRVGHSAFEWFDVHVRDGGSMLEGIGLSPDDERVYEALLTSGRRPTELAGLLEWPVERVSASVFRLGEFGLLESPDGCDSSDVLRAFPPYVALSRIVEKHEAELRARTEEVGNVRTAVDRFLRARDDLRERTTLTRIPDLAGVRTRILELAAAAGRDCGLMLPSHWSGLAASLLGTATLGAVRARVVVQECLVDELTAGAGAPPATIRTVALPAGFLAVFDRSVVLLPMDPYRPDAGVLETRSCGVVGLALAEFDHAWATGHRIGVPAQRGPQGLRDVEVALLRLYADGDTDEVAARKLGYSVRKVRQLVAGLNDRYGCRSRFQLGMRAMEEGVV